MAKPRPPSPGTPGEGGGEGDFENLVLGTRGSGHLVLRIPLTLTLSRSTGRGARSLRLPYKCGPRHSPCISALVGRAVLHSPRPEGPLREADGVAVRAGHGIRT